MFLKDSSTNLILLAYSLIENKILMPYLIHIFLASSDGDVPCLLAEDFFF